MLSFLSSTSFGFDFSWNMSLGGGLFELLFDTGKSLLSSREQDDVGVSLPWLFPSLNLNDTGDGVRGMASGSMEAVLCTRIKRTKLPSGSASLGETARSGVSALESPRGDSNCSSPSISLTIRDDCGSKSDVIRSIDTMREHGSTAWAPGAGVVLENERGIGERVW
jgi:hypothetical protein